MNDPNVEPTDVELIDLSKKLINRWQRLGPRLGVSQDDINVILRNDKYFPTHDIKAHAMLLEWKDRGIPFTYGNLAEALRGEGLGRLAEQFFSSQVNIWCSVTYNKNSMNC